MPRPGEPSEAELTRRLGMMRSQGINVAAMLDRTVEAGHMDARKSRRIEAALSPEEER